MTTTYTLHIYDDGSDVPATRIAFHDRADAVWEGETYADRYEVVAETFTLPVPAGYKRDWKGHAWWTYVRDDGMAIGIYPPHDAESDRETVWYVVGRDGHEADYEGSDPTLAYDTANVPMGEIVH